MLRTTLSFEMFMILFEIQYLPGGLQHFERLFQLALLLFLRLHDSVYDYLQLLINPNFYH